MVYSTFSFTDAQTNLRFYSNVDAAIVNDQVAIEHDSGVCVCVSLSVFVYVCECMCVRECESVCVSTIR